MALEGRQELWDRLVQELRSKKRGLNWGRMSLDRFWGDFGFLGGCFFVFLGGGFFFLAFLFWGVELSLLDHFLEDLLG